MKHWLAALLLCLAAFAPQAASAREEIRSFIADITVNADSSLEVTETITVNAEGNAIRRGIYRDIPLRTLDSRGLWTSSGFNLIEVLHNGRVSPYNTEWQGQFFRILIGDENVFISRDVHTYKIRYLIARQLHHFDDYDEVHWNVTGSFWGFPILSAVAYVRLPEGAHAEQLAASTGAFGDAGGDFISSGEGKAEVRFDLTKPLESGQGLTIAVRFTKGFVSQAKGGEAPLESGYTMEIIE